MTHVLASIRVKPVYDTDQKEWLWIFFREGIAQPLLILPEFEMNALRGILQMEQDRRAEQQEQKVSK